MDFIRSFKDKKYIFTKGAPDFLIPHCSRYINSQGNIVNITPEYLNTLRNNITAYADATLRTLLLTYK